MQIITQCLLFCAAVALGVASSPVRAGSSDALWQIVHDRCVPAAEGAPVEQPCAEVNRAGGYAVLKDLVGVAQYLLIPTARVSGIESPALLEPETPNYWRDAWNARHYVDDALRRLLPRDELSLAVNSASGRTQNQLHIHIDCLADDVAETLRETGPGIGTQWKPLPVRLRGHRYRAMRIDDADLSRTDPFRLLAATVAQEGGSMGDQTLLLVGGQRSDGAPAFFLLNDSVGPGDLASSEELQDHTCALAGRTIIKP
ncbi:CDP-diacylglycerol diphosphatase [Caballeronia sp. LZ062]|uniref:CDP-diacylglycerol diphosphatase n=1 Tax=unclassified Caballeronia TaxID=2646786 RepID=UPI0028654EB7|nr:MULTISPECIES: CDP-diacylglycerol diphosphatase [unclassified Caballeronia]MDR5856759.1 CDP-diacylglycerol diphosphatase [Caballeronia sp. LZ050]MDR5869844.1 CDP-diacylglycerol diphosphatase [Caballeronia sp. LZ062]